jgi:hypothetical protein
MGSGILIKRPSNETKRFVKLYQGIKPYKCALSERIQANAFSAAFSFAHDRSILVWNIRKGRDGIDDRQFT